MFPEFTQVFKDPNGPSALAFREKFPTPQALAAASMTALRDARTAHYPSDTNLAVLQQLASQSIGTHNLGGQRGLLLEQTQLIAELKLLQSHIDQLDQEIAEIMSNSREGKEPPEPKLYDPALHRAHREGGYRSQKPRQRKGKVIQLPRREG